MSSHKIQRWIIDHYGIGYGNKKNPHTNNENGSNMSLL